MIPVNGLAALFILTTSIGLGCSKDSKSAPGGGPGGGARGPVAFPVEAVPVAARDVEYSITAVGSVEAFEVVQVTARVPGAVEKVHFREGDSVRDGEVLVEIEPERYRLVLEEARASREKAEASLAEAEAGLSRREGANDKTAGLIPGEEIDAWRTRVRTARAELSAQDASLQIAERNASDARPQAPFAGTIQTRTVQTGEYVQPGRLLTTLVRRDPLLLRFQVPEGDAVRLAPGQPARFRVRQDDNEYAAKVVHVAASADAASRMVAVTAEVQDPARDRLRPGAFAEIVVPTGSSGNAPVIPQSAVRPSEQGFLAYVVTGGVAESRLLTLGLRTADGLVEVRAGLEPSDSLVVRGAEALFDGARVRVIRSNPEKRDASSGTISGQGRTDSIPSAEGRTS